MLYLKAPTRQCGVPGTSEMLQKAIQYRTVEGALSTLLPSIHAAHWQSF